MLTVSLVIFLTFYQRDTIVPTDLLHVILALELSLLYFYYQILVQSKEGIEFNLEFPKCHIEGQVSVQTWYNQSYYKYFCWQLIRIISENRSLHGAAQNMCFYELCAPRKSGRCSFG